MRYLDTGSIVVAGITLVLFIAALLVKGVARHLLLEAGVFLISVKIIMMVHKNAVMEERLDGKLDSILELLRKRDARDAGRD